MDLVYICKPGENEELRYSIRSAVKNIPHDNLWVVGQKPDWYIGNFIEVDSTKNYYLNARLNLSEICRNKNISDDFILMNDDFYIIKPVNEVKYMYRGLLLDRLNKRSLNSYEMLLKESYLYLHRVLKINNPKDYELHIPMPMNKQKLLPLLKKAGLWRSLYGNSYNVGGELMRDVKVYIDPSKDSYDYTNGDYPYVSSEDESFEILKETILDKLFPDPSPYESPR